MLLLAVSVAPGCADDGSGGNDYGTIDWSTLEQSSYAFDATRHASGAEPDCSATITLQSVQLIVD